MTNDRSNQERAKEYDQIIAMQKILLQTIFRNGVSIGGKPVTLDLNESQRVSLNRVGIKAEKPEQQPTKFNVGDRVVVRDYPSPSPARQFWVITDVHRNNGAVSYRLSSEQNDILDYILDMYLKPYVEPAPVPFLSDDKFKQGDVVEIAKPRDHSEATGKPWVVVSKFSDNTITLGRFGDIDDPSYLKTVPVEILAKFPSPKYGPGEKVVIDDGEPGTHIVKSATLTEHGVWIYEVQPGDSKTHSFGSVEEGDLKPYIEPVPTTPPPLQIPPKFQGGDFVQVKRQRGHWTVELVYPLEPFQAEYQYDVRIDVGSLVNGETSYRLTVVESELELVEPSEEVRFQFEVGDYVRIKATGERRNIVRDAGGDWWVLNGDLRYPTSQLEFISRPAVMQARSGSEILGAFYDTEEPALFDPELVMTRAQRNELMDCLYGGEAKGWEPETILYRIRELFPKPE